MSNFKINVPELLRRHFPFKLGFATQAIADEIFNKFDDIEVLPTNNELTKVSAMGTPVWDFIDLKPSYIEGTGRSVRRLLFSIGNNYRINKTEKGY